MMVFIQLQITEDALAFWDITRRSLSKGKWIEDDSPLEFKLEVTTVEKGFGDI